MNAGPTARDAGAAFVTADDDIVPSLHAAHEINLRLSHRMDSDTHPTRQR